MGTPVLVTSVHFALAPLDPAAHFDKPAERASKATDTYSYNWDVTYVTQHCVSALQRSRELIVILCGFRDKLIDAKRPPSVSTLESFFRKLHQGIGSERILVPKGLFLEARSPQALLGLMGLHNNISTSIWRDHLINMANPPVAEEELPAPREYMREHINE